MAAARTGFDDEFTGPGAAAASSRSTPTAAASTASTSEVLRLGWSAGEKERRRRWAGREVLQRLWPQRVSQGRPARRRSWHAVFEQVRDNGRARLFRSHNPDYADGGQLRDFVWVGDCSDITDLAVAHPFRGRAGEHRHRPGTLLPRSRARDFRRHGQARRRSTSSTRRWRSARSTNISPRPAWSACAPRATPSRSRRWKTGSANIVRDFLDTGDPYW